jgi:hypothetical protein
MESHTQIDRVLLPVFTFISLKIKVSLYYFQSVNGGGRSDIYSYFNRCGFNNFFFMKTKYTGL